MNCLKLDIDFARSMLLLVVRGNFFQPNSVCDRDGKFGGKNACNLSTAFGEEWKQ